MSVYKKIILPFTLLILLIVYTVFTFNYNNSLTKVDFEENISNTSIISDYMNKVIQKIVELKKEYL